MKAKERRERILDIVKNSDVPVPANKLASEFDVSRQIIVQDIAVIRAADDGIIATNRGYIYKNESKCQREFKVKHGYDRTEEECKYKSYGVQSCYCKDEYCFQIRRGKIYEKIGKQPVVPAWKCYERISLPSDRGSK